ncbi:N-succinylglutamate 5-semialdehyde dehydrogenase [Blastomonas aquatica]|uniref:N-succinylglutamate 5-semialdehyde dehydrogenase n=1 Tax=Blastomonas aquatica TaxID=1510276 RepID=A0ABQ1IRN4_9SPHN|nr:N-succinylglutamate 5-semialdehyde dehydrogenase [Blastomonas aquatica]
MPELVSFEPATGARLWAGAHGDVDAEVAKARAAFPEWVAMAVTKRIELCRRFANQVRARSEEFAELIARETGKPLWEARTEVESVVAKIDISVTAYAERTAQRKLDSALGGTMALRHKPHGVMAVLGPYNFPAHLPNGHIIPALIAGNTVVFKPSEKTPATGAMLVECMHQAGIPQGVVRLVIGAVDEGKALVAHNDVDGVLFTGSATTGIAINRSLASQPNKIVALEMGGNNPMVVWDTPCISDAATLIIQSAFTSAGQRCSAASRLIIRDTIYDAVIAETKKLADRIIVGAPFDDPQPFMGPVIDNQTADGLTESFLYFLSNGGRVIKHLVRLDDKVPLLSPAIIDVTAIKDRPDVELFGPLLQVVKVSTFEEAINEANNTRFGLSAALVGGSPQHYKQFWANIKAGIVNWNRPTNGASSKAPFGGVGLSGNHRASAYYAADYCAYPVVSNEMEQPRATIGIGLKQD